MGYSDGTHLRRMQEQTVLTAYVDGSSKQHPRRGGVGILYKYTDLTGVDVSEELPWPGYLGANNQEMELTACIVALENVSEYLRRQPFRHVHILTDSQYVCSNYKNAMFLWPKRHWLRAGGAPVLNAHLWKKLIILIRRSRMRITIEKVKGHSRDKDNRRADKLSKSSAANATQAPVAVRIVRRKKSKQPTVVGSVGMQGQRLTIHISEGQLLQPQRIYRYRYSVQSRASPFYGMVDFICSTLPLHETSTYHVRVNDNQQDPRIEKVFREVSTRAVEVPQPASIESVAENKSTDE